MSSYVTQIEIIRGESYEIRESQVEDFIIDKCVKRIERFHHVTGLESHPKYEAYIYYTLPAPPTITSTYEIVSNGISFTVTTSSPIYLEILEIGIYYNQTGIFTDADSSLLFSLEYGTNTELLSELLFSPNKLYYFQPYIKTCIGTTYATSYSAIYESYLMDTYLEPILDTNSEFIFDV